jgi:thiol-disulfide isomerase/thioredoxin
MTAWAWYAVFVVAALVVLAVFIAGLLYTIIDHERRLGPDLGAVVPNDGLAVGATAPDFSGVDLRSGQPVHLADYAGRRTVVAFVAPNFPPCQELVMDLNRLARDRREIGVLVVAIDGAGVDYARKFSERMAVLGDVDRQIQRAFEVNRTPLVFLLDEVK